MKTAKLFKHGGSQAVRLPKEFRFPGSEVYLVRRQDGVLLRPKRAPKFKTLGDVARYMREHFPHASEFPDRDQPREQQRRDLQF
jgi:antitoxin VapB